MGQSARIKAVPRSILNCRHFARDVSLSRLVLLIFRFFGLLDVLRASVVDGGIVNPALFLVQQKEIGQQAEVQIALHSCPGQGDSLAHVAALMLGSSDGAVPFSTAPPLILLLLQGLLTQTPSVLPSCAFVVMQYFVQLVFEYTLLLHQQRSHGLRCSIWLILVSSDRLPLLALMWPFTCEFEDLADLLDETLRSLSLLESRSICAARSTHCGLRCT